MAILYCGNCLEVLSGIICFVLSLGSLLGNTDLL